MRTRMLAVIGISLIPLACQETRPLLWQADVTILDASDGGSDADGSGDADTGAGTDADADVDADTTDVDGSAGPSTCGGASLTFDGEPAAPGDACGCDGVLVCNGPHALWCRDESPRNACGGCGADDGDPGDPCGACGDGVLRCDGLDLVCDGASEGNLCGGCSPLAGAPRAFCGAAGPPRVWICVEPDRVQCQPVGATNACGSTGDLTFEGEVAWPGDPCEGPCGEGRLVCDLAAGALRCEAPRANACGWCGPLPREPVGTCGCDGLGRWTCDEETGDVVCVGGAPNACGGCDALAAEPGSECDGGGTRVCDGRDMTSCAFTGGETNGCGGSSVLASPPGVACGACGTGRYVCVDRDTVACLGDLGADAFDACGGCEPLAGEPGDSCGFCGEGALVCHATEGLGCGADPGESFLNVCGGCEPLPGPPGAACGTCAAWRCTGGHVECAFTSDDPACTGIPESCASLGCVAANRQCSEGLPGQDAACADCLSGFIELDGACVPKECDTAADCGDTIGEWSECDWADACDTDAERRRTVVPGVCAASFCESGTVYEDVEACEPRVTTGSACGDGGLCEGGECVLPPGAPTVTATTTRPDRVDVSWSAVDGAASYEYRIDGGAWVSTTSRSLSDADAPAPSIDVCATLLDASEGDFTTHVALRCLGTASVPGETVAYEVRARNIAGVGPAGSAVGRRNAGTISLAWERSNSESGPFASLPGATTPTFDDTTAPATGSPRWYRVRALATGVPAVTSATVVGYRTPIPGSGELGETCASDAQCSDGNCADGRCSPPGFIWVPAGAFVMGSPLGEPGRTVGPTPCSGITCNEEDTAEATITRPFFVATHEITQGQWAALVPDTAPSFFDECGPGCPVERVTWFEALEFANRMSEAEGLTECYALTDCTGTPGQGCADDEGACTDGYSCTTATFAGLDCDGYRLPTEAEWEYAYRAGTTTALYNGPLSATGTGSEPNAVAIAWYAHNADLTTRAGGELSPNDWGIFDMAGNVWEWVWDTYQMPRDAALEDPLGPPLSGTRVHRGGFWESPAEDLRAATRGSRRADARNMDLGFRLVRTDVGAPCDDLACDDAHRACATDAAGAGTCGACISGWYERGGACVQTLPAPTVTASTNQTANVTVSWTAVTGATAYHVQVNDGSWTSVGTARTWNDTAAPGGAIAACTPTATIASSRATLSCIATTTAGGARRYRVRAMNGTIPGTESAEVRGWRAVGTLTYLWQYATTSTGAYTDTTGTTATWTDSAFNTTSGTRYYRVVLSATGATSVTSTSVQVP